MNKTIESVSLAIFFLPFLYAQKFTQKSVVLSNKKEHLRKKINLASISHTPDTSNKNRFLCSCLGFFSYVYAIFMFSSLKNVCASKRPAYVSENVCQKNGNIRNAPIIPSNVKWTLIFWHINRKCQRIGWSNTLLASGHKSTYVLLDLWPWLLLSFFVGAHKSISVGWFGDAYIVFT